SVSTANSSTSIMDTADESTWNHSYFAGIVYMIVDGVLGIAGKYEWFQVDSSAVSIMLVLLFAVLTDYSLFVFSRYREELKRHESKYDAMRVAIHHVS